MKTLLSFFIFLSAFSLSFSQCPNDLCETAISLNLCEPQSLSQQCQTDYPGGTIQLAGNITYPPSALGYDQWFSITIDEYMQVIITVDTDFSSPLATWSNLYGWNEGVGMLMWYGENCNDLTPVLVSTGTIASGAYCGANEYTTNPCPNPMSSWTCNDCLSSVDTNSPAYIATVLALPYCCNGWTNQCNNEYNSQVIFYNTAMSAWNWQNGLGPIDGLCPFDPTTQQIELTMTLIPGTYWFQISPFENSQAGYVSEGNGEITVCGLFFLNYDNEEAEETIEFKNPIIREDRFKKVIHPRFGLLIYDTYRDKYYDIRMKHVNVLR